jgi:hypothetical protein
VVVSPLGSAVRSFALRQVLRDGDTLFLRYERPGASPTERVADLSI